MRGIIPGSALDNIVFPDPGGPDIRILCPPAAEIINALLAVSCPTTSAISNSGKAASTKLFISIFFSGSIFFSPIKWKISSFKFLTGITSIPLTTAASLADNTGRKILCLCSFLAYKATNNVPFVCLNPPSSDSSP